jgi:hypothetical protein
MLDKGSIHFYNVPHDGESPGKSPEKGSQNLVLVKRKRPRKEESKWGQFTGEIAFIG